MSDHGKVIDQLLRELQEARSHPDPVFGLPTGLRDLDLRTGGLQKGELTVIAARTSHGKTALAGQIAYDVARHAVATELSGYVLYFSVEMPARSLARREVARMTGISVPRLNAGDLLPEEYEDVLTACDQIRDLPLNIKERAACTVEGIRSLAQEYARHVGVLLLVVDYLGIVTDRNLPAYQATSSAIRTLRELRDDIEAPVLVLSQLRRPQDKEEGKHPEMTELRNSGEIEEAANNVYMIYNPPPDDHDESETRMAEILVRKARDGWTGKIPVRFDPTRVSFLDRDDYVDLEMPG